MIESNVSNIISKKIKNKNKIGFTLVELIVIVVIIAILGTIGFVSYSGYMVNSRDSARISELTRISNAMQAYISINILPLPENAVQITHEGQLISVQGTLSQDILQTINFSDIATDPRDNTPYIYLTDASRNNFQLLSFMENPSSSSISIGNTNRFPKTYGSRLGMLLETETMRPLHEVISPSFELTNPERDITIVLGEDEYVVNNLSALPTLARVTSDRGRGWRVENNNFICLDLNTPGRCIEIGLTAGDPIASGDISSEQIPAANTNCFDPVNVGLIGQSGWDGCEGMLIVDENLLREYGSFSPILCSNTSFNLCQGNDTYAIPGPDGNTYTFEDSQFNVFTGQVTNITGLFAESNFNGDIGYWYTSNMTHTDRLFYRNSDFNQDISGWDVSNVTNMIAMFREAPNFNQDISGWDVSNVTSMRSMFLQNPSFNQPIGNWDISNVTDLGWMFQSAHSFNQSLTSWNTSNVTNMDRLFYDTPFNGTIENWDISNVTSMNQMFRGNTTFNQPLNNWDTSRVQNFSSMFFNATSFNQPLNNWDTSSATNMSTMFRNAQSFIQDLSGWCVSNISSKPTNFDRDTISPDFRNNSAIQPQWGTCP